MLPLPANPTGQGPHDTLVLLLIMVQKVNGSQLPLLVAHVMRKQPNVVFSSSAIW
jgi:hypothetical protein